MYRWENYRGKPPQISLKDVTIAYEQSVIGVVSELNAVSENEHQLRVGSVWYRIYKHGDPSLFDSVAEGSMVRLTAFGCAGNERACDAIFASATTPKD